MHVVAIMEETVMGFHGPLQFIYPFTSKAVDGQYHWRPAALAIVPGSAVLRCIFFAACMISTWFWPVPTVSMMTVPKPEASRISAALNAACGAGNA